MRPFLGREGAREAREVTFIEVPPGSLAEVPIDPQPGRIVRLAGPWERRLARLGRALDRWGGPR